MMADFQAVQTAVEREFFEEVYALCEKVHQKEKASVVEEEIRGDLTSIKQKCTEGFCFCLDALQELSELDPEIRLSKIKHNLINGFGRLSSVDRVHQLGTEAIAGKCWCELLGISDETMEALYKAAKYLFEEGRFGQADAAFSFLTAFDSTNSAFWLGLGHASFHCDNYQKAIQAYAMAHYCDQKSVWPHMYAANTFEAMHNYKQALKALEIARETYEQSGLKDRDFQEALKQRQLLVKEREQTNLW